jgi:hypothetical protein
LVVTSVPRREPEALIESQSYGFVSAQGAEAT